MKNVILTGATGFVGRYVLKQLIEEGYFVVALVRNRIKEKELLEFTGLIGDTFKERLIFINASLEEVNDIKFPTIEYCAWVHLAWGGINRNEINDEEIHKRNYYNSIKCLYVAKELNCEKFIEIGSRAECGNDDNIIPEEMCGEPLNIYGKYKRLFYEFAYNYCINNNIKYLHLRLFAVTGPGDHPWSLVSECCQKFSDDEPMKFGSCEQIWNYLDVRDVSRVIVYLLENYNSIEMDNCILNIASADSKRLKEYITMIYNTTNSSSDLYYSDLKGFDSNPSIEKLKRIYDTERTIAFRDTIKDILDNKSNK